MTKPKQQLRAKAKTGHSPRRRHVPPLLPAAFVMLTAAAGVGLELTTAARFSQSRAFMTLLKRCFIAFVCLASRVQLAPLFAQPAGRPRTLARALRGHAKALLVALAANSAGTTVIRPLFGAAPQYEETARLVVPIYFAVEITLAVLARLRVPVPILQFAVTLGVSWLKAVTISKMVLQWQERGAQAHPAGFVIVSAANLYASGLALRYIRHYHDSGKLLALSLPVVWSVVKILLVSGAIGLVAHVANHLMTQEERRLEAMTLNFLVAWFALDKYWKGPLTAVLQLALEASARRAKLKSE
ncbi:hypothetical protein PybrP1_000366 [[Pythium] brassicae (nom. inval.)]|nr:hypothetical protein PybrP1_000366 [[Pythium] brassicae (nom. inval.)]